MLESWNMCVICGQFQALESFICGEWRRTDRDVEAAGSNPVIPISKKGLAPSAVPAPPPFFVQL